MMSIYFRAAIGGWEPPGKTSCVAGEGRHKRRAYHLTISKTIGYQVIITLLERWVVFETKADDNSYQVLGTPVKMAKMRQPAAIFISHQECKVRECITKRQTGLLYLNISEETSGNQY